MGKLNSSRNRFKHRGQKTLTPNSQGLQWRQRVKFTTETQGFTQVQATARCNTLLLHVWLYFLVENNGELELD